MPDFDRSIFKPQFIAAGMWEAIRVTSNDSPPVITDTHALRRAPDVQLLRSHQSNQYEIKYVHDDLPDLTEGHTVEFIDADGDPIAGRAYRVRSEPYVSDAPSDDRSGYFKRALLTKL